MSKDGLPDAVTKREIVYGNRSWSLGLIECGNRCVKNGQLMDALLYYLKAGATDKIEEVVSLAVEDGNAFLLEQIERLTKEEKGKDLWEKLQENAQNKGKNAYATRAETVLGERG